MTITLLPGGNKGATRGQQAPGLLLRPYQEEAVGAVLAAREAGLQRVLYVLPTGTGKTQVFVGIRQRLGGRALILAHREELLDQAANRFLAVDPTSYPQIEQGSRKAARWAGVVAASVQTLVRGSRLDWFQPDLIVVDEAHHAVSPTHKKVLERFRAFEPGGPLVVGCTATPKRLDKKNLGSIFQETVYSYGIREAIRDGWLCDIRGYRVRTDVDLTKIKSVAGDFNQRELAEAVDVEGRTGAAIRHWQEVAGDRCTIVFCATVEHAKHAAEAWNKVGVPSAHIDGSMGSEERRSLLARFKRGQVQVLTNVEVLTEGFDHPPIGCVVMLRPTESWALFCQAIGRGTRIAPGKDGLVVIDVVDNCGRHQLTTVPAILDLPPDLDLQGRSLAEAADKLELAAERLGALSEGKTAAEALKAYQPKLFHELDSLLEQIDLLAAATPEEVKDARCRLAWVRMPDGSYYFGYGGARDAWLSRDGNGSWVLVMRQGDRVVKRGRAPLGAEAGPIEALFLADNRVRRIWPTVEIPGAADATWRGQRPTPAQMRLLQQFQVAPEIIPQLTAGTASAVISQHRALAREKAGAR